MLNKSLNIANLFPL